MSSFEIFIQRAAEEGVLDRLIFLQSCGTLLQLRVNKYTRTVIDYYLADEFDIDRHLSSWFPDPRSFQQQLKECEGIVSRTHLLHYLSQISNEPASFDIYLLLDGIMPMHKALQTAGYTYNLRYRGNCVENFLRTLTQQVRVNTLMWRSNWYATEAFKISYTNSSDCCMQMIIYRDTPVFQILNQTNSESFLIVVRTYVAQGHYSRSNEFYDRRCRILSFCIFNIGEA